MKILLADDHPLFREGVKPVLLKLDRRVTLTEAHDYPSAFAAMHRAREVDLALLDLFMPGMSGPETVRRMRELDRHVPIALCSGYASEPLNMRADELAPVIMKPYRRAEVEALLAQATARTSRPS